MTKNEIIEKIAVKTGMPKTGAERTLNAFLDAVEDGLAKDGKLTLSGFGTLSVEQRAARMGRNPRTGEAVAIPARKVVKFNPGKMLKETLNPPSA